MNFPLLLCAGLTLASPAFSADEPKGKSGEAKSNPLQDAVILVIRHAEKPASGEGLSEIGKQRARAYVGNFRSFTISGQPLKPDHLFAAADSRASHRSRLTLEPLAKSLGLDVDSRFKTEDFRKLAKEIRAKRQGAVLLIAWHHGDIPALLRALGADPAQMLPKGKWPDDEFGWMIQLRYDQGGKLVQADRVNADTFPRPTP